ncbi:MAG: phosphoribosyltransferase [Longimicrobiales bacterium]
MLLWEYLAPLILGVVLILTVGGVLILRPIARHLGALLEAMTRERLDPSRNQEMTHVREMLETMNQRLQLMEERQEFTDRLLERGGRQDDGG